MKGRLESSLANEARTKKLLKGREQYFVEYYYSMSASKEPTTVYRYLKDALNFVDYLKGENPEFHISNLKKYDIDRYLNTMKYSTKNGEIKPTGDRRMATLWSLLHAFIKFLVGAEYIEKDIMEHSERPKIRNDAHRIFLEQGEIKLVLNKATEVYDVAKTQRDFEGWELRDLLVIRILLETGVRVTALIEINTEDIDFENSNVKVIDKRGKMHTHPLSAETLIMIKEWINYKNKIELNFWGKSTDPLFITKIGRRRISDDDVNNILKKFTSDLDKHITAHKIRGTYATSLYRETGDIYLVKECMGHSNVATTQIYVEPKADTKEKALEIMNKIMSS